MKQSVDLMNSMTLMKSKLNTLLYISARLTCRATIFLALTLLAVGNSAWGQTFNGTLIPGAKTYTKYLANNVNSTTIDMTEDLSQIVSDLNELKGSSVYTVDNIYQHIYVRWCIKDNTDNIVTSIASNVYTMGANDWHITSEQIHDNAPWGSVNGNMFWFYTYNFLYQDADFKAKVLKPQFRVHSSKTFADYEGYTLECYITDDNDGLTYAEHPDWHQSGSITAEPANLKIKYTYVFNADGLPPYELVNETDIAADKTMIPIIDYEAAGSELDVSDALVSGAKYARIYVSKYGNANAESANLTITYDGDPITQCATGNEKYGWYLSESGGIDPTKLSITGLSADEMLKYNVVIVSSEEELSGTQEPAWDKKKVFSFQKDIRNRILGADGDGQDHFALDFQADVLSKLGSSVSDFSKYLYAKWYVLNPGGEKVAIDNLGNSGASQSTWRFDMKDYSIQDWTLDGNDLKYFTDGDARTSDAIEGANGWDAQIAKISRFVCETLRRVPQWCPSPTGGIRPAGLRCRT